jgi:four helix bundle protein
MNYRDLPLWQLAMDVAEQVCRLARAEPRDERFLAFVALRRAAVLVPSQIAHGHERSTRVEQLQGLSLAAGNLAEVETQLLLAARIGQLPTDAVDDLLRATEALARRLREAMRRLDAASAPISQLDHDD